MPDPVVALDTLEKPAYHARRIWHGHGTRASRREGHRQWSERNRVAQGFRLISSHAYDGIIRANAEAFREHPEYFALVNGERRLAGTVDGSGNIKFCISNPGLRQLVVDHAKRVMTAHPDRDSISMDPSDGGNWCECEPCAEMGSISDRVLLLANEVADAVNRLELGDKYVGIYAYGFHSPPPAIDVHPMVIVSATAGFLRGGYTLEEIIRGWQARGATMGIYDYFSVMPWDWDMPGRARAANPSYMAESIPDFYAMGVRFHDAESSDNWGPNGLGYYVAARILWDLAEAERLDDIVDDFLTRAFGPATEPMRAFYRSIDGARRPLLSRDLVGRMYRSLAEARRLAAGDAAVLGRLDDLALYTRYVEFKLEGDDLGALRHCHRIRDNGMLHYRAMWPRMRGRLNLETVPDEWQADEPFEPAEIAALIEAGIAANPILDFTPVSYSEDLVPAAPLNLPSVDPGTLGHIYQRHGYQGGFDLFTWMEAPGSLELEVTGGLIPHFRDRGNIRLRLLSPQEITLDPVATDDSVPPDGERRQVVLATPYDGLHRLELRDGGDASRLVWPEGWPMALPCSPEARRPPVRGIWSLYFYVPKGTDTVAGYMSHAAGRLVDAAGETVLEFADIETPGYFSVPAPEGRNGQLWRVDRAQGRLILMTVPPYLARSEKELLLPREVVEADAAPPNADAAAQP